MVYLIQGPSPQKTISANIGARGDLLLLEGAPRLMRAFPPDSSPVVATIPKVRYLAEQVGITDIYAE